ncbi:MAG TPA: DUF3300 domain-containing protein [Burkholderiales bacterium]|nr:DUF3300 domain-containing protein [Burkholderiales bacterium]
MHRARSHAAAAALAAALAAAGTFAQPAPPPAGLSLSTAPTFKNEELEQLAAPIALYPDALLAQILMASTYPLEVVEAARWSKANPQVKDKALEDAMQQQTWDPSVKSLTAFPQVLAMMDAKLDWTQKLGDAFLAQQKELMDAVQRLRAKAQAAGNLKSGKEQTVTADQQGGSTVYAIEPASPQVVYVPVYNPAIVYGPWPYPGYPPYYYYPPGPPPGAVFFWFTAGIIVGSAMWGHCNWHGGGVYINVNNYNRYNHTNINNPNWQHNVDHRKGVQYRDAATQQRFGGGARPGADSREAFRGRDQGGPAGGGDGKFGQPGGGDRSLGTGGAGGDRGISTGGIGGGREPGAFEGVGRGGETRDFSNRGAASRASPGGFGGGARGGGGGRGGGGRR